MSFERYTPFSTGNDDEGVKFGLDGDLYYSKEKKSKKQSKEDRIYGIFGSGYDSDEDDKPKSKASLFNFSKGVSGFVKSDKLLIEPQDSKGVKVTFSKNQKDNKANEKPKPHKDKTEKKKKVSFADDLMKDLMFDEGREKDEDKFSDFVESDEEKEQENKKSSGDIDEEDNIFDAAESRKRKTIDFRKQALERRQEAKLPTAFGAKPKKKEKVKGPVSTDPNYEEKMEELYGKGWKIMQSLGYKGTGLGKNEQGRLDPLQAVKKTVLDGDYATSTKFINETTEKKKKSATDDLLDDLKDELAKEARENRGEEDEDEEETEEVPSWKKENKFKAPKRRNRIKARDLIVPESEIIKPIMETKVIDMRGPITVVIDDYTGLKSLEKQKETISLPSQMKSKFLGEMLLSLKGSLEKVKHDIMNSQRKIKLEKDKIVTYEFERKKAEQEMNQAKSKIENYKQIKERILIFKERGPQLSASETVDLFLDAYMSAPQQFFDKQLDLLFVSDITSKLRTEMLNWKISLSTLGQNFELFQEIREFLIQLLKFKEKLKYKSYLDDSDQDLASAFSTTFNQKDLDDYMYEIINQTWAPPFRNFIVNEWNPKDFEVPIQLIHKWEYSIPVEIMNQIYDSCIMPKLQQAVEQWSPVSDTMMIHIWIHPWLPVLGMERIATLWKPIQHKISQVLQQWNPKDESAYHILKPWLRYFERSSWEGLMLRCILPKLVYALEGFTVNPKKQVIEPVQWLLKWSEFIGEDLLADILEKYIMNKLEEVGQEWIASHGSTREIEGWLKGWKELLGKRILNISVVSRCFDRIERLLNK